MQKVIVIGCPGAGKSTFARQLREVTGLPLYYLDMLWHRPDRTNPPREEFDARLEELLREECWIIDGNYNRTLERRLQACDTVFFLDLPVETCLEGAQARIGQKREDLPWVEEEFDAEFRQWILDFPRDQLPHIRKLLDRFQGEKEVIAFRAREEMEGYLQRIKS